MVGPVLGGAITQGIAWQWIFWLNVPIGLVAIALVLRRLDESYGPRAALDLPGLGARHRRGPRPGVGAGARQLGRLGEPGGAGSLAGGAALIVAFARGSCVRERRCCRCACLRLAASPQATR